ncbi:hypothetical protein [Pararhodospirillum photometricum]|nr:hypothetical protein [Pararhodospirillum photometricum]
MPIMPTSYHAFNLFTLTMETRFGSTWRADMAAPAVIALAEEIARGFGGRAQSSRDGHTVWRFPDRSLARTSAEGLVQDESSAADSWHRAAS